eukprot:c8087_g1_i1.p1 GENE.c8087_g1_i1~~c8087_g1_i1.p1  ORF type:complete len:386 (+),score=65.42 c8087_g1_i1:31-1158(+)
MAGTSKPFAKCSWTAEEDENLTQLVAEHGAKKWSIIAQSMLSRTGKQCRERWHNHLCPSVRKDAWTHEEDELITELVQHIGTRWAAIAKHLPGRTDNAVKNRYYSWLRKLGASRTERPEPESKRTETTRLRTKRRLSEDSWSTESHTSETARTQSIPSVASGETELPPQQPLEPAVHAQTSQSTIDYEEDDQSEKIVESSVPSFGAPGVFPSRAVSWESLLGYTSEESEHVVIERPRKIRRTINSPAPSEDRNFVVRSSPVQTIDFSNGLPEGLRVLRVPAAVVLEMMKGSEYGKKLELERRSAREVPIPSFQLCSPTLQPSDRFDEDLWPVEYQNPIFSSRNHEFSLMGAAEAEALVDSMKRMAHVSQFLDFAD